MPVYKVKIWYTTHVTREVEAKDIEDAEYQAVIGDTDEKQVIENLEAMEYVNEVELSDCQYTDQQELQDRERDHEL